MYYNPKFQAFQSDPQGVFSFSPQPGTWFNSEKETSTGSAPLEVLQTRKDGEISAVDTLITQFQRIKQLYKFREQAEVVQFLEAYPFLVPLLLEASSKIKTYFSDAQLFLKVVADPEAIEDGTEGDLEAADDYNELVVFIATHLAPRQAVERLKQFYQDWWINVSSEAKGKLSINLECL